MEEFQNQSSSTNSGFLNGQVKIFYSSLTSENSIASIIVVHGFSEHSERHMYLIKKLHKTGFDVYALDLRGHGKSEGERGFIKSIQDYVDDVTLLINHLKAQKPKVKIGIVAHSMGGLVSLFALTKRVDGIFALALSNPLFKVAFHIPWWKNFLAMTLARFNPHLTIKSGIDPKHLCTDIQEIKSYSQDPLILKKASLGWYRQIAFALEKACQITNLSVPLLMQISPHDEVVDNAKSKEWFLALADPYNQNTLIEYPHFMHELYNEKNKDLPINDLISWLKLKLMISA